MTGKFKRRALRFLDVFRPFAVRVGLVDAQADNLDAALVEFGFSRAHSPSSVVQTGVKSLGWEKSTAQLSPIHS